MDDYSGCCWVSSDPFHQPEHLFPTCCVLAEKNSQLPTCSRKQLLSQQKPASLGSYRAAAWSPRQRLCVSGTPLKTATSYKYINYGTKQNELSVMMGTKYVGRTHKETESRRMRDKLGSQQFHKAKHSKMHMQYGQILGSSTKVSKTAYFKMSFSSNTYLKRRFQGFHWV